MAIANNYSNNKFVTVQAKTSLVHTSDFVNLKTHKIFLDSSTKLEISAMIEECMDYKSCKYQLVMLILIIFMNHQSDRIGGVN